MMNTTITVTPNFPMTPGEVIKIKNSNGKGVWRQYTVGKKVRESEDKTSVTYKAQMEGSIQ